MSKVLILVKKELQFYGNSAVAYVVGLMFLLISSVYLFNIRQFVAQDQASLRAYFSIFPFLFSFIIPALTMRTWAEEQRNGTLEVLLTLPFKEIQLVLGKFLALVVLFGGLLVLTLPVPIMVSFLGHFDFGVIAGEYLGMFLLGMAEIALGIYISSLSKNQVVAFLLTTAIALVLTLIDQIGRFTELPGFVVLLLQYLSFGYHSESFIKGIVDSRDLVFFLTITAFFLFLNERQLVLKKWR